LASDDDDLELEFLLGLAEEHGRDSEPDHEVGDLQDLCRAMWRELQDWQRQRVLASPEVGNLRESAGLE
jgi:hypothetical protein